MEKTTMQAPGQGKVFYRTPHFAVLLVNLSGPADMAAELRRKYVIVDKEGVVYGTAAHIGQAQVAAIQAEQELTLAGAIVEEAEARSFAPNTDGNGSAPPPLKFP